VTLNNLTMTGASVSIVIGSMPPGTTASGVTLFVHNAPLSELHDEDGFDCVGGTSDTGFVIPFGGSYTVKCSEEDQVAVIDLVLGGMSGITEVIHPCMSGDQVIPNSCSWRLVIPCNRDELCTSAPTNTPTAAPTMSPTSGPTKQPTGLPTSSPTLVPTKAPSPAPTSSPTSSPTRGPSGAPTSAPTVSPTKAPTHEPTAGPTSTPTKAPSTTPTFSPTAGPTQVQSKAPTLVPTGIPTGTPTPAPTAGPTSTPTKAPSPVPTSSPTAGPTPVPSKAPTLAPTRVPTGTPTPAPTTTPTAGPTWASTPAPTFVPTKAPIGLLTVGPTKAPTGLPTPTPTNPPTGVPTKTPTGAPIPCPTKEPTLAPTKAQTGVPTGIPTLPPTKAPTGLPTPTPTNPPTGVPTKTPTGAPIPYPTKDPTTAPTVGPTKVPTGLPTLVPTVTPTKTPTVLPTKTPTASPTTGSPCSSCVVGSNTILSWKCANDVYYCPGVTSICGNQGSQNSIYYPLTAQQCEDMKDIQIDDKCVTIVDNNGNTIIGQGLSNYVCYAGNGNMGTKVDSDGCGQCTYTIPLPPFPVPTSIPTKAPTITTTKSPTASPTKSPTSSPTIGPTTAPTKSPTKAPIMSPTSAPTQVKDPPPSPGCPYNTLDFSDMTIGTWVYQDLWYSQGMEIKAISSTGFTPNANGVHNPSGGGVMVVGGGGGGGTCASSPGSGIAIQATDCTCPGPTASGIIEVSFAQPTYVATVEISGQCNGIRLFFASGGSQVMDVSIRDTNGGVWIYKKDVIKVEVQCPGAGVLEAITYMFCPINGCPVFHLDFSDLSPGQYISDEWKLSKGVIIEALRDGVGHTEQGFTPSRSSGYQTNVVTGGAARAFNTANPIEDPDLGAPNQDFGGPGKGCGGGKFYQYSSNTGCQSFAGSNGIPNCNPGCVYSVGKSTTKATSASQLVLNPFVNDTPQGNVLIIQEEKKTNPDDTSAGGWINFYFNPPASVEKVQVLDIDEGVTPLVTLTYAGGKPNTSFSLPATGDDGFVQKEIYATDVTKLSIYYTGSGCISELHYGSCPPSPSTAVQNWKAGDPPLH
jgi:hypothetical protein